MIPLKYATASQEVPLGYFVDSTDGDSEETGLTIANTDIKLWKSGATTLANKNSGGATHIANGVYYATLDATDTDTYGPLVIFVHVAGALTVRLECVVMEASAYDALYAAAGSGHIEADVVQWKGATAPANTGDAFARIGATGSGLTSLASAAAATAIEADTQDIQSRLPASLSSGNMRSDMLAVSTSTDAADKLEASVGTIENAATIAGTLTTTAFTTNLTEATDDHYIGRVVIFTSGALLRQATEITDYAGATKTVTVAAMTEAPGAGDTFIIV